MIVVADTSPLNYLILIQEINILASLYGEVIIPPAVQDEMLHPDAPSPVRAWINNAPSWLEVRTPDRVPIDLNLRLDDGEREAISLVHAGDAGSLLLIDELRGRQEATRLGLEVIGTLGILREAHFRGLVDLHAALDRLKATNFKASEALLKKFEG